MTGLAGHGLSVVKVAAIVAGRAGNAFFFLRTWQQAFALSLLACSLAGTANGFCFFTDTALGWLFKSLARLHFTEETFPLHLLLQDPKGLFNIVITNENLQSFSLPMLVSPCGGYLTTIRQAFEELPLRQSGEARTLFISAPKIQCTQAIYLSIPAAKPTILVMQPG
jgi:hypothetical protein